MTPASHGLLGASLAAAYSPRDFARLEPVAERRGPCDALGLAPAPWIAQARIEVNAASAYLRRQALYAQMIDACDVDDSD